MDNNSGYGERNVDPRRALLSIAIDLTAAISARDRLARLLEALRRAVPCDALAVLGLEGDDLVPLVTHGLAPEVEGRRFSRREHPRLDVALTRRGPVRFPADSELPDPYDGLLLVNPDATRDVHACLACPLVDGDAVVGLLTADALEPGAFDHIDDEFLELLGALAGAALHTGRLIEAAERAAHRHERVASVLIRDQALRDSGGEILGTSAGIQRVRDEVELVARSNFAVLITGETGVGKELVARSIHSGSLRGEAPLIDINCAALPDTIVESELFGHVRGAFTGAMNHRAGKFEIADGGTLFLDEVGELPLSTQSKLLRTLETGEIQRVGADRPIIVDVRVVAATNRDLEAEVAAGRFRSDLYHRLHMYPIRVPSLRERAGDIPLLSGFFLDRYRRRLGLGPIRLTEEARLALLDAEWPGNVRELDHLLGRAVLRASGAVSRGAPIRVAAEHLGLGQSGSRASTSGASPSAPPSAGASPAGPVVSVSGKHLGDVVEEVKRVAVSHAVEANAGNWAAAARSLGMARGNLHHLGQRLGLLPHSKEPEG